MGSLRVGHDWATSLSLFTFMHWRRNGNSLQCSCLKNPRDGGAQWAAVYGVTHNQTRLKLLSSRRKRRRIEKERVWENFLRDYSWKFPQHGKGNNQVQEAQRVPYRINPRRTMPRHMLIKLTKNKHKERILKAAREKQQVTYKGNLTYLTVDLFSKTLQATREWQDIFTIVKGKNLQPNYSTQQGSHSKLMEK